MVADTSALNPVVSAIDWLQSALLGSIATTAAVIAVGGVGYLMLTGRIDVRRAVQVVFGCFILFGAPNIAQGITAGISGLGAQPASVTDLEPPLIDSPPPAYPKKPAQPFDPYAGAAVPTQQ